MRAQLLMGSMFTLALAISFVVFVLLVFAGICRYYQNSGQAMDRMSLTGAVAALATTQ